MNVEDKILVPKLPKNCARCGHPVNGPYCQGCTLLQEKLKKDLVSYFQNFKNISEPSDDSTSVVNAPREPFVFKQDHDVNPPHIDECCCECGNALDGIFCQQCTCKSCGKGAHIGYNCPLKVPIISNPKPCNQTMNNELPQTLPSFETTCYSDKENSVPCVSKPNFVDESSNIFNPPPQPPIYYCEFYKSNAQYVYYCTPQAPFINPEPGYSQDFNFSQNIPDFKQQYLCCDQCGGPHETFQCQQVIFYEPCCENCGGPHETFQCQPTNEEYYHEQNSCYNFNSFGFDHCQRPQYTVNRPIFNIHNDILTSQTRIMEQMTTLTSMCEMNIPACCDDDDDYNSAITPVLSTEETENSLSMEDEHLDTILATESDEVIKSSVENLVPIPSEFEGIPSTMCDMHLVNNPTPLEAKDHFVIVINSNDDISSSDDDSLYNENIEYVEASPHDSEVVSLEVAEIVIPKEEEIEDISSGSTTTDSDISLPDYEFFYFHDNHIEEISSGSTTTHSDISLSEYDSFTFDLSNDQCPPTDRSNFTHKKFVDELAHIISPPEYDCFYFRNLPDPGELFPEQTKHLLTLELLLFHLMDFSLNCCESSGNDIH
nr:hypothetical protein [Tanacetum cinerariifolium]